MPNMNNDYLNSIANHGASIVTHIGLVSNMGTEISTRQEVTWTAAVDGTIRPSVDLTFAIEAGTTVGGWRGYSALTDGTEYGGKDLTNETYANAGEYTLLAASTGILHT